MFRVHSTHPSQSARPSATHPPAAAGSALGAIRQEDAALIADHPDLLPQGEAPSPARLRHDEIATDSAFHYDSTSPDLGALLAHRLIRSIVDPHPEQPRFQGICTGLVQVLALAYRDSACFRRLFNHADLGNVLQRWHLSSEGACCAIVGSARDGHGDDRDVLTLNLDFWIVPDPARVPSYQAANGRQFMTPVRAFLHPIVSALTRLPDIDGSHPRGPNIEYVNIVCKQLEYDEPACTVFEPVHLTMPLPVAEMGLTQGPCAPAPACANARGTVIVAQRFATDAPPPA
ncbi:MAG TPA: PipA/GogA/GtgA family type III secretion system effector, partial [Pararobbsia sp.]|nr:PipA/GogA/GtgA family type III secretion system effector [Pararobbsia sp.]